MGHDRDHVRSRPISQAADQVPSNAAEGERVAIARIKQGRAIFGVELEIRDGEGNDLPHDGKAFGDLLIRGPVDRALPISRWRTANAPDGWFFTGDVATIDAEGFMQITDRSKDVIKSGGEWISSIELENLAMSHPDIARSRGDRRETSEMG